MIRDVMFIKTSLFRLVYFQCLKGKSLVNNKDKIPIL